MNWNGFEYNGYLNIDVNRNEYNNNTTDRNKNKIRWMNVIKEIESLRKNIIQQQYKKWACMPKLKTNACAMDDVWWNKIHRNMIK